MTKKQQLAAAPKYGLYMEGLGWLANEQPLSGVIFTTDKALATQFTENFDNPITKLSIWNAAFANQYKIYDIKFEAVYL